MELLDQLFARFDEGLAAPDTPRLLWCGGHPCGDPSVATIVSSSGTLVAGQEEVMAAGGR